MPVPLTTALLAAGAIVSAISETACVILMSLGLLNQLIVEVVTFNAGDDDGLG